MLRPEAPILIPSTLVADPLLPSLRPIHPASKPLRREPLHRNPLISVWPAPAEIVVPSLAVTDMERALSSSAEGWEL